MLTYLFLSIGTQANGDHTCPVRRRFEEFTSHQLDSRRPTVHANLALKSEQSECVTPGHLSSGAYYVESRKPTHLLYFQPLLFSCCDPYGRAAPPATRVTLLQPGKECEKRQEMSKVQHELASQSKPYYADQKQTRRTHYQSISKKNAL